MEALLGMVLLLQVVISIQIMLGKKQVLQQLRDQKKKIKEMTDMLLQESEAPSQMLPTPENCLQTGETECLKSQKESPEALINEVLSQVF